MTRASARSWLLGLACACVGGCAHALEPPLTGTLTSVGSDTASTLVATWSVEFQARHPGVRVQVQASGSASAPVALLEGAADIGPMSRAMDAVERSAFERRGRAPPLGLLVAHDAIAVFVHPDNPRTRMTLAELDAIYSVERRCGAASALRNWRDAAPTSADSGRSVPILAIGRDTGSGTHALFRELALCNGTYQPAVIAWPGNGAVVASVAGNPEAIGYSGAAYANGLVRVLAIAADDEAPALRPDEAAISSGRYPLSRGLHVYVNRNAEGRPAALAEAFLDYALSDEAQDRARRAGFVPLGASERMAQRAMLAR
jgi:phosphate transport system substrate-binding protein